MHSRYTWLYLLKAKIEVYRVFVEFKQHVEVLLSRKIKMLQTDNGGEFRGLEPLLTQRGITIRRSCPHPMDKIDS